MLSTRLQKSVTKSKEPVDKNTFFDKIVQSFDDVMLYEDEELQKQAKKLIPVDLLEIKSVRTFRELQR